MTKKTLVSAITAALVVGAASTTFAAANPFSDVPTDSWAYNAVVTLANDGVIDGFPNGTFQGNKNMTRYEMAQIIARAMAKENMTKADKALVDKLAVEFASELNNLGVRVANLEEKSDNVKLTGKVQYNYTNKVVKDTKEDAAENSPSEFLFRLDPTATLGNGWTAHARLDAKLDAGQDQYSTLVTVDRAYVEGPLAGATVTAGKLPGFLANGLVFDGKLSGAKVVAQNNGLSFTAVAGRSNLKDFNFAEKLGANLITGTNNLYAGQVDYKLNDKISVNAGYVTANSIKIQDENKKEFNKSAAVWYLGADAQVVDNVKLSAEYAKASKDLAYEDYSPLKKAYSVELSYRGHDEQDAGSYGAYVAYRHLGLPALVPTYDGVGVFEKGVEYGVSYVPAKNVVATVKYFDGKQIAEKDAKKVSKFYGNLEFLF